MTKSIKLPLSLAVIITVIITAYWLSNNDTPVSFIEPSDITDQFEQVSTQPKSLLSPAMDNVSKAEKVEQLLTVTQQEKARQAKRFLPKKATPVSLSEQELSILKEKSQLLQAEINLLIAQYGENISDQEKTQDLQAQVKILMAEYNELILPLALNSMAEKNNG